MERECAAFERVWKCLLAGAGTAAAEEGEAVIPTVTVGETTTEGTTGETPTATTIEGAAGGIGTDEGLHLRREEERDLEADLYHPGGLALDRLRREVGLRL